MNRVLSSFLAIFSFTCSLIQAQQCPTLSQNATLTSPDCQPGLNPCTLCPGDTYTLNANGNNLHVGDCINWYVSTTPGFNPYNGQGTLLGCSEITTPPPDPCNPNPILLGFFVNACGTEENNEFLAMWSGGGFYVSDLSITYDDPANNGCGFQSPSGDVVSSIGDDCPGAVYVGPGEAVPANVPVIIFTSASTDFNYNFGGLCANFGTVYVLQSSCTPSGEGVFPQTGSGGSTTTVSIGCWSDAISYNINQLVGGNGAFVAQVPILGTTFYGNAGCSWPGFPGLPGDDPIIMVEPLEVEVTADECNMGPYYIVGIYEPLPQNCPQVFTNYLSYDVVCPEPELGTADLCANSPPFNLVTIQDPGVPSGTWSGTGVTGTTFNPAGLSGPIPLTFTPTSDCGVPATTTITVFEAVTAMIDSVPTVCAGGSVLLTVHFTGTGPWTFDLTANGSPVGSFNTFDNPFIIPVAPTANTNYVIRNLRDDAGCTGPNASRQVLVSSGAAVATLSLIGNDTICSATPAQFSVSFQNGVPAYGFVYAINGIAQPPVNNINTSPYLLSFNLSSTSTVSLVSMTDNGGCPGTASGQATVAVLPSPTALLTSDTVQVCAGATDSLTIKFTGTAPFIYTFRINGVAQPQDTALSNMIKVPVLPVGDTVVYTLLGVWDSICVGTASGIYRVIVSPLPTATISANQTICPGGTGTLNFNLTGTGPFLITYSANGVQQPSVQANATPFSIQVSPTVTTTYSLLSVEGNGCSGTVSGVGVIAIAQPATGVVSGGGQTCQGGSGATVTFTFTGTGPFTFIHSLNNVPQAPITTSQNVYTIQSNPSVGTTYRLVSLTDGNNCTGTVSGVALVLVFVPATGIMLGDATFCDSANTNVIVDFTGSGPFTIGYSINGVAQPPVFTSDDPYLIPVDVNTTTTYVLTEIESPGCVGVPVGSATITVNYAPSYANLDLNCDPASSTYTVSFDILGGSPPYTLLAGSGSFNGNQFTSNAIPQGNGYNIIFRDTKNCGNIAVSGPSTCNCSTEAGDMDLAPLSACANDTVTATYLGGAFNDGNDLLMYILHSNPALPLGTIYGWNTQPSFSLGAGMNTGTTYYISAISGDPDGNGIIDLNDLCLSVSQGTPVVFNALPGADLGNTAVSVCQGDSATININLTGTPPFSVTPVLNGVTQPAITGINGSSYSYIFLPASNTAVTLSQVSDQFCGGGTVTGAASVSLLPVPAFGQVTVNCDYANDAYSLDFTVTGTPPYNLANLLATFNGTSFTTLPIPSGTPYSGVLTDANNCGSDTLQGVQICRCDSEAGTMPQNNLNACAGTPLNLPPAQGIVLEPGDTLLYIMHTNPGIPVGTIVAWGNTPNFTFGPGMQTGQTYYISSIVGNPNGSGQIDLNDQCLSVANGTPIVWRNSPTATMTSGTFNICPGGAQSLLVTLTGSPGYTLTYTSNGTSYTVNPTNNLFSINAQLQQTATIVLTSVSDASGCPGTVSGQATVIVHPAPQVINIVENCDLINQTYTVEFTVSNGDLATINVQNLPGMYNPATGQFVSDPRPISQPNYSFTVKDVWNCGTFSYAEMAECSCITDVGIMSPGNLTLCSNDAASFPPATGTVLEPNQDLLQYYLTIGTNPATWNIISTSNNPLFSFDQATMSYGTTYQVMAVAGNSTPGGTINLTDPCLSVTPGPTVTWRPPVTAAISGGGTICAGSGITLPVTLSGNGPFSIAYSDGTTTQQINNVTQNPYQLAVNPAVNTVYTLVSVTGAGTCAGNTNGFAPVQVNPIPQVFGLQENCNLFNETYMLSFSINNGSASNNFTVTGLIGTVTDSVFTSQAYPGAQPYTVVIRDAIGCSTTVSGQPNCLCATSAGTLANGQNACLPGGTVSAQQSGNATLDSNDALRYLLCTDPALLPAGVLAQSAQPQFPFQPGVMTAGTTYYIVASASNPLPNGNVDFSDPCVSFSAGVPVIFRAAPSATISGTQAVCPGSSAQLQIDFSGQAPFQYQYAINGTPQSTQGSGNSSVSLPLTGVQQNLTVTLVSISDAFCPGTVSGQGLVTLLPTPTGALSGSTTVCAGASAQLTLNLSGAPSFNVIISGGTQPVTLSNAVNGQTFPVTPSATTTYQIAVLQPQGNSCTPSIGAGATVTVNTVSASAALSDYNGFNVRCASDNNGSITITPQSGTAPFTAVWSNGNTGLSQTNLSAGGYDITLTDALGCQWNQSLQLNAPPALSVNTSLSRPVCFGQDNGFISISGITGGGGPYQIAVNGTDQGFADVFPFVIQGLRSGEYQLEIEDKNGCLLETTETILSPLQLTVSLGPDTTIQFGDSIYLVPVINSPKLDTFIWSPVTWLAQPDSFYTKAGPPSSITYTLYIKDEQGCEARDEIYVGVNRKPRVYLPNAIKPDSPELNDAFTVFGGPEVARVRYMRIFDRWGELVFENNDFLPNDTRSGWKGTHRGQYVNPGVFVYVIEVEYFSGETEIFAGDVTVIR